MKNLSPGRTAASAVGAAGLEPTVPSAWAAALAAAAAAGLLYWAACKLALFADLAYGGSDFYSALQMSKSFRYTGVLLYDNIYGYGAAIHNNYLLLLFFPLTYPLGAYGLIVGLLVLYALAIVRLLRTPVLSFWGRLAVLGAVLSPMAFWILDDPRWGFHVELCNPPLGVLFTLALLERRRPAAVLLGLALILVKEDGAVLVAAVLVAYFLARLMVGDASATRLLRGACASLAVCLLVFLAGLALLHLVGRSQALPQDTSTARLAEALHNTATALSGRGPREWSVRLGRGLVGWALLAFACGLPLLRRLPVHLLLFAAGSVALLPALVVSSALYGFVEVWWAPRMATVLTLVAACLTITAALFRPCSWGGATRRRLLAVTMAAIAAGWAGWSALLAWRINYHVLERANLRSLMSGRGQPIARLHEDELRFARCLAAGLPRDFPLGTVGPQTPVFHHQALTFFGSEFKAHPWQPPRLVVVYARHRHPPPSPLARVRRLFVTGDPELTPLLRRCGAEATVRSQSNRSSILAAWIPTPSNVQWRTAVMTVTCPPVRR
ncbi:MAG TPA: hypothetical protein VMX54_21265 [Vicinamibacteria bacterium]|nr:hypothetical protein [Vicinamibacteria bacterium]